MTIGVATITIYLHESHSLKNKRGVVKSLIARAQRQFNVAIAEVDDLDDMRVATIAVVCVSTSAAHADQMLQTLIGYIERNVEFGSLGEIATELIPWS